MGPQSLAPSLVGAPCETAYSFQSVFFSQARYWRVRRVALGSTCPQAKSCARPAQTAHLERPAKPSVRTRRRSQSASVASSGAVPLAFLPTRSAPRSRPHTSHRKTGRRRRCRGRRRRACLRMRRTTAAPQTRMCATGAQAPRVEKRERPWNFQALIRPTFLASTGSISLNSACTASGSF